MHKFRPASRPLKIVALCKRRPMGRDLIERPYGRFFHLPVQLAARGHEVHVALLSYKLEPRVDEHREQIHWISEGLATGGIGYVRRVHSLIREVAPDWIVGFSDTYYGILAQRLARKHRSKSLIDAYDNYEGYLPWCKPLHFAWRKALRSATAISVAGPALADLSARPDASERACIAPMAVDPYGFEPLSRADCRAKLGLPQDSPLVGYFGAIYLNRGIELLFDAFDELRKALPNARLVLSGRIGPGAKLPSDAIWLGYVPDEQMPTLINSVNAVAVVNRRSMFGNYSHPIKLYEAMSCQVPVVASRTPATEWILAGHPDLLVEPESKEDMARGLEEALRLDRIDYGTQHTWGDVAERIESFLLKC